MSIAKEKTITPQIVGETDQPSPDLMIDNSVVEYSFGIDWIDLCMMIDRDNRNELDTAIAIQGGEGSGKSGVALTLCKSLYRKFDLYVDVCYKDDWEKYWDLMYSKEPGRAWMLDEAQWFIFSLDFSKRESKESIKEFMSRRYLEQIIVCCTPTILKTIDYLRDHRFRWNLIARYEEIQGEIVRGFLDIYKRGEYSKQGIRMTYWKYLGTLKDIAWLPKEVAVAYKTNKSLTDIRLSKRARGRKVA